MKFDILVYILSWAKATPKASNSCIKQVEYLDGHACINKYATVKYDKTWVKKLI